jgi:dihydropteroate synthase
VADVNAPSGVGFRGWRIGDRWWRPDRIPGLMGIVNVTPDSFSDGGRLTDTGAAVRHALGLVEQGADFLDVGGESTRPGSEPVSTDEELRRVLPVIERLRRETDVPISIDTTKAAVAQSALEAGAVIVNDISGLTFDPRMPAVCAETAASVVCMHIQGTPQTMQIDPRYEDVVAEVRDFLRVRLANLERAGIAPERVAVDPGIGFGKTAEHNLRLLASVSALQELGQPVLIGHSRKGFLKKLLGRPVDERTSGTIGVSIALAAQGVEMLRIHDVRAVKDALIAWRTVIDSVEVVSKPVILLTRSASEGPDP